MSVINKYVDKIFVINLPHRTDRAKLIDEQLKKYNITNYEWFNAIYTNYANIDAYMKQYNYRFYGGSYRCFPGTLGCLLSHVEVLKIARNRGYNRILILEDDAVFQDDFEEKMISVIKDTMNVDYDMLYLGANYMAPSIPVTNNLRKVQVAYTTHAYIIPKKLFNEVIDTAVNHGKQIDIFYVDCIQSRGNCYGVNPNIISQSGLSSDVITYLTGDVTTCSTYFPELKEQ